MSGNRDELDIYERAARVQRNTGDGEVNDRVQEEISDDGGSSSDNDSNGSDSSGDRSFSRDPSEMIDRSSGSSSDNSGQSFSPGPGDRQPPSSGSSEQDNSPSTEPNRSDPQRDGSSAREAAVDDGAQTGSSEPDRSSQTEESASAGSGSRNTQTTEPDRSDPQSDGSSARSDAVEDKSQSSSSGDEDIFDRAATVQRNRFGFANERVREEVGEDEQVGQEIVDAVDEQRDADVGQEDLEIQDGEVTFSEQFREEQRQQRQEEQRQREEAGEELQESLGQQGQRKQQQAERQQFDAAAGRLESELEDELGADDLDRGEDFNVNETDDGQFEARLTDEFRREQARGRIEARLEEQAGRDVERGEFDATFGEQTGPRSDRPTAEAIDQLADEGGTGEVGGTVRLDESLRRELSDRTVGTDSGELSAGQRTSGESTGPEPAVDPVGATVNAVGESLDTTAVAGGEGGEQTITTVEEEFGEAGRELTQAAQGNRQDLEEQDLGEGDGVAGTVGAAFEGGALTFGRSPDNLGTDLTAAANAPAAVSQGATVTREVDDLLMTTTVAGGEGGDETIQAAEEDAEQTAAVASQAVQSARRNPTDVTIQALLGAGIGSGAFSTVRRGSGLEPSGPGTSRSVVEGAREGVDNIEQIGRQLARDDRAMAGPPNRALFDTEADADVELTAENLDVNREPRRPPEQRSDFDDDEIRQRQTDRNQRRNDEGNFDPGRGDTLMERRARRRRGAREIENQSPTVDARDIDSTRRQTPDSDLRSRGRSEDPLRGALSRQRRAQQRSVTQRDVLAGTAGAGVSLSQGSEQSQSLAEALEPSVNRQTFVEPGVGSSVLGGIESDVLGRPADDIDVGVGNQEQTAGNETVFGVSDGTTTGVNTGTFSALQSGGETDTTTTPTTMTPTTTPNTTTSTPSRTTTLIPGSPGTPRRDGDLDGDAGSLSSNRGVSGSQRRAGEEAGATGFIAETFAGFGSGGLNIDATEAADEGQGLLATQAQAEDSERFEEAENLFTFGGDR